MSCDEDSSKTKNNLESEEEYFNQSYQTTKESQSIKTGFKTFITKTGVNKMYQFVLARVFITKIITYFHRQHYLAYFVR